MEAWPEEQVVAEGSSDRLGTRGRMGNGGGASVKLPEWLPDGWIMKTKRRKEGKVDRVIPNFSYGGGSRNLSASPNSLFFVCL